MIFNPEQIKNECGWHERAVLNSNTCGCFYCLSVFHPSEIEDWIDEPVNSPRGPGKTALCPYCCFDAVLPESTNYELSTDLLRAINKLRF